MVTPVATLPEVTDASAVTATPPGVTLSRVENTPEHLTQLAHIGAITFHAAFAHAHTPQDMAAYLAEAFNQETLQALLADPRATFTLVYLQDTLIGYTHTIAHESRGLTCLPGTRPGMLKRLYLLPQAQGHGLGTFLLHHACDTLTSQGCDAIWLTVWQDNHKALALYTRHGFHHVGFTEFVIGDEVHQDWVMARVL